MDLDDETLQDIENSLVTSALQSHDWDKAVSRIATATGARGVVAIPLKGRVPGLPMSASLDGLADKVQGTRYDERGMTLVDA